MKTYRTNAVMAGALYILGTVAGILSVVAVGGFPDEDFLARMAADPSRLILGAFFIVIMGFSLAAMTLFLYPLFRKDSEPLAMGMVLFRGAFEGTWYILSALIWVTLAALIKEIASAGADSAALQAVGNVVLQADGKLGDIGTFAFIIGAACLYTSFYRTRLIPRWLSVWGLVGCGSVSGQLPAALLRHRPRSAVPSTTVGRAGDGDGALADHQGLQPGRSQGAGWGSSADASARRLVLHRAAACNLAQDRTLKRTGDDGEPADRADAILRSGILRSELRAAHPPSVGRAGRDGEIAGGPPKRAAATILQPKSSHFDGRSRGGAGADGTTGHGG